MDTNEKREFTRVPFRTEVKLSAANKTIISNKLQNISLGGAFISSEESFPPGTMCLLEIKLTGPASLLKIGVEAKVVRAEDHGMGVQIQQNGCGQPDTSASYSKDSIRRPQGGGSGIQPKIASD